MIRAAHFSDTHGGQFWRYADLTTIDLVIHTGDLMPNYNPENLAIEQGFQDLWLKQHKSAFEAWLGDVPFIYVPGNHDFIELNSVWNVTRIGLDVQEILGKKFIGYPNIPQIVGRWNWETDKTTLQVLAAKVTESDADVLLTHVPPAGVFSQQYGCDALASCLFYKDHKIKTHCFGHVHLDKYNQANYNGITFSNAASDLDGLDAYRGGLVKI